MARRLRWSSFALAWALGATLSGCMVEPKALAQAFSALQLKPQGPAPGASAQALKPQGGARSQTMSDEAFLQPPTAPSGLTFKPNGRQLEDAWVLRAAPASLAGAMVFLPEGPTQPEDLVVLAGLAQVEADMREAALTNLLSPTHREIMRLGYPTWLEQHGPMAAGAGQPAAAPGLPMGAGLTGASPRQILQAEASPPSDGVENFGGLIVSKRVGVVLVPMALPGSPLDQAPESTEGPGVGPKAALVCSLPGRRKTAEGLYQAALSVGTVGDPAMDNEAVNRLQPFATGVGYEGHDLTLSLFSSGTRSGPSARLQRRVRVIDGAYVHRMEGLLDEGRFALMWRGPKQAADWTAPSPTVEAVGEGYLEAASGIVRFRILRGPDRHLALPGR